MSWRPLTCFSLLFAIGIGLEFLVGMQWCLTTGIFAVVFVIGAVAVRFRRAFFAAICFAGFLSGFLHAWFYETHIEQPFVNWNGFHRRITVTAVEYPEQYEDEQRVEVRIPAEQLSLTTATHTFLTLPKTDEEIEPGDSLSIHTKFYVPERADGFDRPAYYRSIGCPVLATHTAQTEIVVTKPSVRPLWYYPKALRQTWQSSLSDWFPERQAAFLSALLFGQKDGLSTIDRNHLRKAGLSHVTAVSGLHIGFLLGFLLLLFGRKAGSLLGLPVLLAYIAMIGASPSVLRASMMYGLVLLAFLIGRETDSITSLATALLLCLVIRPVSLLSASLQLSFAATAGILWLAVPIQTVCTAPARKMPYVVRRAFSWFASVIACSFCALLFTTPILLLHFSYLSVLSPLTNFLTLWAVTLTFALGILFCVVVSFCAPIAHIVAALLSILVQYIWGVTDLTANIRGGVLCVDHVIDILLLLLMSLLFILSVRSRKRKIIMASLPLYVLFLFGYSYVEYHIAQNELRVTCFYEGYGQCIAVRYGEYLALIDCGSSGYHNAAQDVAEYMDWYGIHQVDVLILTAGNSSHSRDVEELAALVPVREVYLAEQGEQTLTELETVSFTILDDEGRYSVGAPSLDLEVMPIDGHLAVLIASSGDSSVMVTHSLTQLRILHLLERYPTSCRTLVAADSISEDNDRLCSIMSQLTPEQIILESGWTHDWDMLYGVPVQFVDEQGETTIIVPPIEQK